MTVRLHYYYLSTLRPIILHKLKRENVKRIPKLKAVNLQITSKDVLADKKQIIPLKLTFELLTGQKPIFIRARKSLATFNLRQGKIFGWKVTLRRSKLYSFLDKFIHTAMPRIREFKAYSETSLTNFKNLKSTAEASIKGNANLAVGSLSLGVSDINCFPEVEGQFELFQKLIRHYPIGFHLNISTTDVTVIGTKTLLGSFQVPFRK